MEKPKILVLPIGGGGWIFNKLLPGSIDPTYIIIENPYEE